MSRQKEDGAKEAALGTAAGGPVAPSEWARPVPAYRTVEIAFYETDTVPAACSYPGCRSAVSPHHSPHLIEAPFIQAFRDEVEMLRAEAGSDGAYIEQLRMAVAQASEGLRNIASQARADGNRRIETMAVHWLKKLPKRDNDFDAGRVAETIAQAELDVEQMARAIHKSGIANCRVECPDPTEFSGFSGADYDLASLLIKEYAR